MPQVHKKEDDEKHLAEGDKQSDWSVECAEIDEGHAGSQKRQSDQAEKNNNIGLLRLDLLRH